MMATMTQCWGAEVARRKVWLLEWYYFNNMCAMCYSSVACIICVVVYNFMRPGKDVVEFQKWWKRGR